jgi:hypothetical protein
MPTDRESKPNRALHLSNQWHSAFWHCRILSWFPLGTHMYLAWGHDHFLPLLSNPQRQPMIVNIKFDQNRSDNLALQHEKTAVYSETVTCAINRSSEDTNFTSLYNFNSEHSASINTGSAVYPIPEKEAVTETHRTASLSPLQFNVQEVPKCFYSCRMHICYATQLPPPVTLSIGKWGSTRTHPETYEIFS